MTIAALKKRHQSLVGYLVFGLVELGLAYGFISLAIDRGNLGYYLLTLIFAVGAIKNLLGMFRKALYGRFKTS